MPRFKLTKTHSSRRKKKPRSYSKLAKLGGATLGLAAVLVESGLWGKTKEILQSYRLIKKAELNSSLRDSNLLSKMTRFLAYFFLGKKVKIDLPPPSEKSGLEILELRSKYTPLQKIPLALWKLICKAFSMFWVKRGTETDVKAAENKATEALGVMKGCKYNIKLLLHPDLLPIQILKRGMTKDNATDAKKEIKTLEWLENAPYPLWLFFEKHVASEDIKKSLTEHFKTSYERDLFDGWMKEKPE